MKTIFRFLGLAVLISGFAAAGVTNVFAQDPAATPAPAAAAGPCEDSVNQEALYKKYMDNYNAKDVQRRQLAVDGGEEYLKLYGACEPLKVQVDYLKGAIPALKANIIKQGDSEKLAKLSTAWDAAVKAEKWDDVYSLGKQVLELNPEALNVILVMGSVDLDETLKNPRVLKYNDDTLKYARLGIQKLEAGKTSSLFGFGKFTYVVLKTPGDLKSADIPASKDNALGWLNYTIGAITYVAQNNKKDGLSSIYKASQARSTTSKLPQLYAIIGDFYFDEVNRLAGDYKAKVIAAGNKDTDETKAITASIKAYAERGIDAYARAQGFVDKAKNQAYWTALGTNVENLYKVRFEKVDGLSAFVTESLKKPLPDPNTVPAPIVEAEPVVAPTTTGTPGTTGTAPAATGAKPAAAPATNGTKPAATTPATTKKPVSTNGTPAALSADVASTTKAAVKKPVVKKKGTK